MTDSADERHWKDEASPLDEANVASLGRLSCSLDLAPMDGHGINGAR